MYTTDDLIASVKSRAAVPTAQNTFSATDFLRFGTEEISSKMLPLILHNIEDFYSKIVSITIVSGTSNYAIPSRAVAGALRNVQVILNPQAGQGSNNNRIQLQRLAPEDLYVLSSSWGWAIQKVGFYFEGNDIVIFPTPQQENSVLRLTYYMRPGQLVPVSACARVTAIDTGTGDVTCSAVPSTFTVNTPLDMVQAKPGFDYVTYDATPTNVSGDVITFASIPSTLAVGDYICLSGQSCVVQVPAELQPLLSQYVAIRCLSAQTDSEALKNALAELKVLEANANMLIAPRAVSSPKRATSGSGGPVRWV